MMSFVPKVNHADEFCSYGSIKLSDLNQNPMEDVPEAMWPSPEAKAPDRKINPHDVKLASSHTSCNYSYRTH